MVSVPRIVVAAPASGAGKTTVATVVVDCEPHRGVRLGLAAELAAVLRAEHLDLGDVAAGNLIRAVNERKVA